MAVSGTKTETAPETGAPEKTELGNEGSVPRQDPSVRDLHRKGVIDGLNRGPENLSVNRRPDSSHARRGKSVGGDGGHLGDAAAHDINKKLAYLQSAGLKVGWYETNDISVGRPRINKS